MVAICSLPSGSKKSKAMRRPSACQSEKRPGRSVSTLTCVPSGIARKSGTPRPVSGSTWRKAIGPLRPGKVASAVAAANAVNMSVTAAMRRARRTAARLALFGIVFMVIALLVVVVVVSARAATRRREHQRGRHRARSLDR
jgi:hypothetical protein